MHTLEKDLRAGVQALGLALTDAQIAQLLAYMDLIQKWTRVYNLTAVRDPAEMLTHHLLDSLAVIAPLQKQLSVRVSLLQSGEAMRFAPCPSPAAQAPPLPAQNALPPGSSMVGVPVRLLDVGSGAGLPGAVIAICCPQVLVHCVDTVAKKTAFIQQVAGTLKLPNLRAIQARVESLTDTYDVVSSRAFASLVDFVTWSQKALAKQGMWMAMKGKHPADELAALPSFAQVFHVEPLDVPGLGAERCVVWMRSPVVPA